MMALKRQIQMDGPLFAPVQTTGMTMTEIEQNTTVDERLRDLYNKSRLLREYSQWLKRRSEELQQRSQFCVNSRQSGNRLAFERQLTFRLDRLPDCSDPQAPHASGVMIES